MIPASLTLREILADVPHDGGAIFVYLLLAVCLAAIWRAGRGRAESPAAGAAEPHDPSHERSR